MLSKVVYIKNPKFNILADNFMEVTKTVEYRQ